MKTYKVCQAGKAALQNLIGPKLKKTAFYRNKGMFIPALIIGIVRPKLSV